MQHESLSILGRLENKLKLLLVFDSEQQPDPVVHEILVGDFFNLVKIPELDYFLLSFDLVWENG